ncbi:hypothetical protein [Methylocystis sp. ATCC 49242]|uniref:hypothetical protein n=1 Tax=Methylocystis sp. ATCC 49242 TaxID=622637 RepID=UPI0006873DBE|nr:hypothetical protein [Methylocystis sp. ATCC 49242]
MPPSQAPADTVSKTSRIAQGSVLALAAFMFVAGIGVHFTGSSNTAFLKGQMAQTSRCELDGESAYPDARRGRSGIIGKYIVSCTASSGFDWTDQSQLCREAPVATNGYCYEPTAWFDRVVTQAHSFVFYLGARLLSSRPYTATPLWSCSPRR